MRWITAKYELTCQGKYAGSYLAFNNGTYSYYVNTWEREIEGFKDLLEKNGLLKDKTTKKPMAFFVEMMNDSNRVKGKKKAMYVNGPFTLTRIPQETGERFMVYRRDARKGEVCYSDKNHSAPHYEGPNTPEGMNEWTTWYAFEKMDDGSFVAALDESWWWGGGHNDGGTIRTEIPEEWHELPYDEFLKNVVTLSSASHHGFTPEELKAKKGLKEFFGFTE